MTKASSEVSIATLGSSPTRLYMNGRHRGQSPHRVAYFSEDEGSSWSDPVVSTLLDDAGAPGCERAVVQANGTLFTSEPQGEGRTAMVLNCSTDDGASWSYGRHLNNDKHGGYSDIVVLGHGKLLVVWEDNESHNMWSHQVGTEWCG